MNNRDFNTRIDAMRTYSRYIQAARDVLVNGVGLREAARVHGGNVAGIQRLVTKIRDLNVCRCCGQVIKPKE